jgi:hypothetical protein
MKTFIAPPEKLLVRSKKQAAFAALARCTRIIIWTTDTFV